VKREFARRVEEDYNKFANYAYCTGCTLVTYVGWLVHHFATYKHPLSFTAALLLSLYCASDSLRALRMNEGITEAFLKYLKRELLPPEEREMREVSKDNFIIEKQE
jgi:hypothetical protein